MREIHEQIVVKNVSLLFYVKHPSVRPFLYSKHPPNPSKIPKKYLAFKTIKRSKNKTKTEDKRFVFSCHPAPLDSVAIQLSSA